jgi:hypothetical protein
LDALPRNAQEGYPQRTLELVAISQLDLIAPLAKNDTERDVICRIVAGRRNLRDRYAF